MQTYDNKGAEIYTNGSAAHMNGTDLTKMKEVAFEKSPSEPMVRLIIADTLVFCRRGQVCVSDVLVFFSAGRASL